MLKARNNAGKFPYGTCVTIFNSTQSINKSNNYEKH